MEELLQEIGLSIREIKVYRALLEIGLSSVGRIIEKSGIPSSKIYETLNKLIEKGLASSIIKEGKKHFQASDPKMLVYFMDEKKKRVLEEALPILESIKNKNIENEEATIYSGYKGIKSIFERMIRDSKKGGCIYVMGTSKTGQHKIEEYLINLNRRRVKKGVIMKAIYHQDSKDYGKIREKMPLTEVRYFPKTEVFPAWIDIFEDVVITFDFSSKTPRAFLIKSRAIAESYKIFFDKLWKIAKKP